MKRLLLLSLAVFSFASLRAADEEKAHEPAAASDVAVIKTTDGTIVVGFWRDVAPNTVANFLKLAKEGFYDGTAFHRIIPGFMIQGGGFTPDMDQKKNNAPIKNEAANGLKNKRGTLSMARTNDINSVTSQFFINLVDNDFLDHKPGNYGYAVFGRVVSGMDVIDEIAKVKTGRHGMHSDVPVESIVINSAKSIDK